MGWRERALCKGADQINFFPPRDEAWRVDIAKAMCESCPVTEECREFSFENNERFGVWGGLTENERTKIRVKRNREYRASRDRRRQRRAS